MPLPTAKTEPTLTVDTAKVFLFGPPKIGKTTLAGSIDPEHTLFLTTEPGLGALSVWAREVKDWDDFRKVGPELTAEPHQYKTIVIDTVDGLHKMCQDAVMKKLNAAHPSDLEWGKGYAAVTDEFELRVGALASLGLGMWFISHAKDVEIKQRVGTITKAVPTIGGGAQKWLLGFSDFILYAVSEQHSDGERRVLHTKQTENFEAGGRVTLPDPLPLDADALRTAMQNASPKQSSPPPATEEPTASKTTSNDTTTPAAKPEEIAA